MTIKANFKLFADNQDILVEMEGKLDYENGLPFRDQLLNLSKVYPQSTLILNMEKVDFVGSSGIGLFVETFRLLKTEGTKVQLANVRSEFLKVFKLYHFTDYESIIDDLAFSNRDPGTLAPLVAPSSQKTKKTAKPSPHLKIENGLN